MVKQLPLFPFLLSILYCVGINVPKMLERSSKTTNTEGSGMEVLRGQLEIRPVDADRTLVRKMLWEKEENKQE